MLFMIIFDIIITVLIFIPTYRAGKAWESWIKRSSMHVRRFTETRRFGARSWTARSFIVRASKAHVVAAIDALGKKDLMTNPSAPGAQSEWSALAAMSGRTNVETGIVVEWLDNRTAELRARQYSDWPALLEDREPLPLRQRQRLAEHAMLYVDSESPDETRVSYELQLPVWIPTAVYAVFLTFVWITWLIGTISSNSILSADLNTHGISVLSLLWNCVFIWILSALTGVNLIRTVLMHNISLLDSLISSFGPTVPS